MPNGPRTIRPVCEDAPQSTPGNAPEGPAAQPERDAPGPAAAVKPRPAPPKVDQLPPYRVLLHNDDVNTVEYVIVSLVQLTPLDAGRATLVTLEADVTGVSLVTVCHQELAEFYQERLQSKGLTVTIEPAE